MKRNLMLTAAALTIAAGSFAAQAQYDPDLQPKPWKRAAVAKQATSEPVRVNPEQTDAPGRDHGRLADPFEPARRAQ